MASNYEALPTGPGSSPWTFKGVRYFFLGNFEWTDFSGVFFFLCFSSPFSFLELKNVHLNFIVLYCVDTSCTIAIYFLTSDEGRYFDTAVESLLLH